MSSDITGHISSRCDLISKTISRLENRLNQMPDGHVTIKHQHGKAYYYFYDKALGEKYLTADDNNTIRVYFQKEYLKKVTAVAKDELKAWQRILAVYPKHMIEDVYEQLPKEYKVYVTPIVLGDDEFVQRWQNTPYKAKTIKKNLPVYLTMRGERVRSKSEVIIADRLFANGIPYKYECPLEVNGKIIHPDFTILKLSSRDEVYYEHCGMMDDPDYSGNMVKRVNDYSKAGIYLGDRLFLSFETSDEPLDERIIDNYINTHFR